MKIATTLAAAVFSLRCGRPVQAQLPDPSLRVVQDAFQTFLLLPQARTLVERSKDSASLLGVLVRNAARNMRRRHHRALPHEPLEDEPNLAAEDVSVDEAIERAEDHLRLLGA
jgi:RNA polymerase sigma-70 factor, ECF subfamily